MNNSLQYALQVLRLIDQLVAAGEDIGDLAKTAVAVIERGGDPTDAEWDELNRQTEDLERRIREA